MRDSVWWAERRYKVEVPLQVPLQRVLGLCYQQYRAPEPKAKSQKVKSRKPLAQVQVPAAPGALPCCSTSCPLK